MRIFKKFALSAGGECQRFVWIVKRKRPSSYSRYDRHEQLRMNETLDMN